MMKFSAILLITVLVAGSANGSRRQPVEFSVSEPGLGSSKVTLSKKETQRLERYLSAVFPVRTMKRLEHVHEEPMLRRATYSLIEQDGRRFVLVGYTARWSTAVNVFAVYRIENGTPNQVWRSKPWEANYDRLAIQTAGAGKRNIVLFEEGGGIGEFALASVFTFQNAKDGIIVSDLTPSLPWLLARTHFPFRPLYGESITLKLDESNQKDILLTATDQTFQIGLVNATHLERTWKYSAKRNRFEHARERKTRPSQLTHIGD